MVWDIDDHNKSEKSTSFGLQQFEILNFTIAFYFIFPVALDVLLSTLSRSLRFPILFLFFIFGLCLSVVFRGLYV